MQPLFRSRRDRLDRLRRQREEAVEAAARRSAIPENGTQTCPGCGEHTPKEELMALMQYMVNHNTAHANELAGLAKKLEESGDKAACDQVMLAVSDFEKGNLRLSAILASMRG